MLPRALKASSVRMGFAFILFWLMQFHKKRQTKNSRWRASERLIIKAEQEESVYSWTKPLNLWNNFNFRAPNFVASEDI